MAFSESKPLVLLKTLALAAVAVPLSLQVFGYSDAFADSAGQADRLQFNEKGEMIRPEAEVFRKWVFVGANVTPAELNEGADLAFPGFHNTYIHPEDYDHFKETGEFRDGTQFIQENTGIATTEGESGMGYFAGEIWGLKASVKSKERFPDREQNVGFFKFQGIYSDPAQETSAVFSVESCNACHTASAKDSDVFTQYYPVLLDVDPK